MPGALSRYPVGDLAGVGPAVVKRLAAAGIDDLGALLTTDVRRGKLRLYEAWGFPEVWVEVPDRSAPSRPRGGFRG